MCVSVTRSSAEGTDGAWFVVHGLHVGFAVDNWDSVVSRNTVREYHNSYFR
jgi:hypothetical protein